MKTFTVTFTNGTTCKVDSPNAEQARVKVFILVGGWSLEHGSKIASIKECTDPIVYAPRLKVSR